jgi:2-iminobutanoate/2-iminopropanoate deaminase
MAVPVTKRRVIPVELVPGLTAPISWAVAWGDLLFCSGVFGQDLETGTWGDARTQVRQSLGHVQRILHQAGTSADNVLSVTAYLAHRGDYDVFNEEYRAVFGDSFPARTTIQSEFVFPEMLVEISCVAGLPS